MIFIRNRHSVGTQDKKNSVNIVLKRRIDRCSTLVSSSLVAKSISNVKPGGTGMIMDGKWASRIIEKGEDPQKMGRWSYVILGGRNKKAVMFVTAYRVVIQKIQDVGPKTAMAQHYGILSEQGVKNSDPRKQFIKD